MLYSRQDMAVLLLYYLRFSGIRNTILRRRRSAVARFLAFHDVLPEETNKLENNLRFLKYNTNVITFDDFFSNRLRVDKINTVITFDDGYKGWIAHALPILKRLNLPATFFISSGFVGLKKHDELTYTKKNLFVKLPPRKITGGLTPADMRTLVVEGFTIGGHTLNHCSLDSINDTSKLRYEITEDKSRLEKMIGVKIDYFSYPTGAHANPQINIVDELIAAGYKGAVTVSPGFNSSETNRYLLHRDLVNDGMSLPIFKARVFGDVDAIRILKRWRGLAG
jgi:peptidoglycan/xylan/chitin deacetylase (PgdA/CDA1 family)